MTVKEMLIGIDLILNKINSNSISSFKDEEKLWFLNEEQIRFINDRINPLSDDKHLGMQANQKRYDDLEEVIRSTKLSVYRESVDDDFIYSYLPIDYFSLISSNSKTKNLCGLAYNPNINNTNYYYYIIQIPPSFKGISFTLNSVVKYNSNNYFTNDYDDVKINKFDNLNLLVDKLNSIDGIEAAFDTLRDIKSIGNIIIITDNNALWGTSSWTWTNGGNTPTTTNAVLQTKSVNRVNNDNISGFKSWNNRIVKTEDLSSLLTSSFGKTLTYSPIATLQEKKIFVYHNSDFLIKEILIDYVKKPRIISLAANQSCELNVNVHQEIVDNTAKRMLAYVMGQNYQAVAQENQSKE